MVQESRKFGQKLKQNSGFSAWPMFIVTTLSVVILVNIVFAYLAVTSDVGLIDESPYKNSVKYQSVIDQEEKSLKLGWNLSIDFVGEENLNGKRVTLTLTDRDGLPINEAGISFTAIRPANSDYDTEGVLEYIDSSEGRYITSIATTLVSGLWLIELNIVKGDDIYIDRIKKVV